MVNLVKSIFTLLKHLMMLLSTIFSGLHFYTLPETLIACGAMQLRFLKVKTLVNNAFKHEFVNKIGLIILYMYIMYHYLLLLLFFVNLIPEMFNVFEFTVSQNSYNSILVTYKN